MVIKYRSGRASNSDETMPMTMSGHARRGSSMNAANSSACAGHIAADPATDFDRYPSAYSSGYPTPSHQRMRRLNRRSARAAGKLVLVIATLDSQSVAQVLQRENGQPQIQTAQP